MEKQKIDELEARLIAFAVNIVRLVESIPLTPGSRTISNQLIRSGTAPALNYGEARSAESSQDFIHKMKIALKELRESFIALKIMKQIINEENKLIDTCLIECNELISIFVRSIQTAEKNRKLRGEY